MNGQGAPKLARWLVRRCLNLEDAARLLEGLDEEFVEHIAVHRTRAQARRWYWSQVLRSIPPLLHARAKKRRAEPVPWVGRRFGSALAGVPLDLLHLLRMLRRTPWSAGSTVLTLALTLGLGTAIFALVDAVLLRPLPYADPHDLVVVGPTPMGEPGTPPRAVPYSDFASWRAVGSPRVELEGFDPSNATLTGLGAAERVSVTEATAGLLDMLGAAPSLGRGFQPTDAGQAVAVVSHGFWKTRLSGEVAVLGREIVLNGRPHTIIGVLPERFFFALNRSDVWRPLPLFDLADERDRPALRVVGRLSPGATPAAAVRRLEAETAVSTDGNVLRALPLSSVVTGNSGLTLGLLAVAGALAILVAFSNLAALLIVRSIDRGKELALRSALGAGPREALRQLLLEALALGVLGVVGGVLLALLITPALGRFVLEFGGMSLAPPDVSWRAVSVVALGSLALSGICGAYPALSTARYQAGGALQGSGTPTRRQMSTRRFFVAGQVAIAFVLLVSLAQVGRSLQSVLEIGPGFDPTGLMKLQVSLPGTTYGRPAQVTAFYSEVLSELDRQLGAGTSASISEVPLTGDGGRTSIGLRPGEASREVVLRNASRGYFEVMGVPVLAGRSFDQTDAASAPVRAVVSESLARRLAGTEDLVGSTIWLGRGDLRADVIGVVGDVKHRALEESVLGTVYLSSDQVPSAASVLVVRSTRPDDVVASTVSGVVQRIDGSVPVYRVEAMTDVVARSPGVPARRVLTAAFAGSTLLALLLSTVGLFGVLAHDVASRKGELAIRMALGATPRRIVAITVRSGAVLVGTGLLLGGTASVWAGRGLEGVLLSTQEGAWAAASILSAFVLVAAGALAVVPVALRASRREPSDALRGD